MMLKITKHARDKMSALAISTEMIKTAIQRGSKFKAGGNKLRATYSYFSVVYKRLSADICKIVTVYENR